MQGEHMNAIGIDVSKGTSTVAIVRPFGEIVRIPFDVPHTTKELDKLATLILSLDGETRVVMENTGHYHEPIAHALRNAGIFVSVPNAKILRNYGGDSIRYAKTDPLDSLKIASYCLDRWVKLKPYQPEDECRKTLKIYNRQLAEYAKIKVMLKNNLIALLNQTFSGVNKLFTSPAREDGHEKWIDFVARFWHADCVKALSEAAFHYATKVGVESVATNFQPTRQVKSMH
jgi:transposase